MVGYILSIVFLIVALVVVVLVWRRDVNSFGRSIEERDVMLRTRAEEIAQRDIPNELENNTEILEEDFNRTVSTVFKTSNEHDKRVMNYITKLFYSNINNK